MKKSMYEANVEIIVNALVLECEREEAFVESIVHDALDPYEFYGEDKYSSLEEALRESTARLEAITSSTPATGGEWRWAKRLHDATREWAWWAHDAETRLRKVNKNTIALDVMKGRDEDKGPWYPAEKTVTVTVELGGNRPCEDAFAVLYKGVGDGDDRRSVPVESKRGPLMTVLSLIEK